MLQFLYNQQEINDSILYIISLLLKAASPYQKLTFKRVGRELHLRA